MVTQLSLLELKFKACCSSFPPFFLPFFLLFFFPLLLYLIVSLDFCFRTSKTDAESLFPISLPLCFFLVKVSFIYLYLCFLKMCTYRSSCLLVFLDTFVGLLCLFYLFLCYDDHNCTFYSRYRYTLV